MKGVDVPLDVLALELEVEDHAAIVAHYRRRLDAGDETARDLLQKAEAARVEALYLVFDLKVEMVISGQWDSQLAKDRRSKRPLPVGRAGRQGPDIWDLLACSQGVKLDRRRGRAVALPPDDDENVSKIREAIARYEQQEYEDRVAPKLGPSTCSCLTRPGTDNGATTWREWSARLKACSRHGRVE